MAERQKAKGGKKNRKYDRNRKFCVTYLAQGRREANKRRKLNRHIASQPNDRNAKRALARL